MESAVSGPQELSLPHASEPVPVLYWLLRELARPALRSLFSLRTEGLEHLPARGPYILAANHANYLDGVVLGTVVPHKITFLVMPGVYHSTPLHPPFHRHVGSIPINLDRPDPGAIKRALRTLEEGNVVGIFPEGPFSRNGRLGRGQPGVAIIALRSGVPVVPVAIRGTYQALVGRPMHLPRPYPLSARFGRPIELGRVKRGMKIGRTMRADVTCRIMDAIAALLADGRPTAAEV